MSFTGPDNSNATSSLPGGGICDETYTITGTFTSATTFGATVTATFSGGFCSNCSSQSWSVTGTT